MSDTILAVDLGRYKSVACVYQRSSREHAFRTFDTTPAELTKLLARHPGSLVVIEACANAGWVLVRCWAMLRNGQRWRADPVPNPAKG